MILWFRKRFRIDCVWTVVLLPYYTRVTPGGNGSQAYIIAASVPIIILVVMKPFSWRCRLNWDRLLASTWSHSEQKLPQGFVVTHPWPLCLHRPSRGSYFLAEISGCSWDALELGVRKRTTGKIGKFQVPLHEKRLANLPSRRKRKLSHRRG